MTDFSVPQRMSGGAFLIFFIKYLKDFSGAFFVLFAISLFRDQASFAGFVVRLLFALSCCAAFALAMAAAAYFHRKFYVADGNIIYRHFLISRTTTTIPLSSIHSLRTRRGILYRLLDLRGIIIDTLAFKGEEIELILSESDWQSLHRLIQRQERPQAVTPDQPPIYNPSFHKIFSNEDLVLDALCQNHLKGMAVFGALLAMIFKAGSDLFEENIDLIADYLETHIGGWSVSVAGVAFVLAAIYALSLMLWLAKVLLRYYNMTLTYDSRQLTFNHGLLTRASSRFAYDKICTLLVKRNFLESHFGLCTLALRQALNASAQKEDDNLKIYGRDISSFFLGWWLGENYSKESETITVRSGRGIAIRSLLPDLLLVGATTAVLCTFGLYTWVALPATYLIIAVIKGICAKLHSHISLRDTYLVIGNGNFADIKNYLKYNNIEVVRIKSSPFTRFTGRVTLLLSTSGTTFAVRSLKNDDAMRVRELLLAKDGDFTTVL